ncbi:MAG: hypothetical protein H6R26_123 [Proteobacteria bacterium]|nr:hypothetical protein [Pseudomonadota bacterium]
MRGRTQAVIGVAGLALISLMIPLVSLFSSAALALVALRMGARESLWVLAVSAVVATLAGTLLMGSVQVALVYGLLLWVPVWPVALLLRTTGQLALALEAGVVLGVLAVVAVYLLTGDPAQLWSENLQRFLQPMLEHAPPGFDSQQVSERLQFFAHYMTGLAAAGSLMSLIFGLLIARWWQASLFNPGGFRAEFVGLRLHTGVAYAGVGCIAAALLAGEGVAEFAWNTSAVFFVLFAVAGFAVMHSLLGRKNFLLAGLYVSLLILPQILLPVAFVGFSDPWLNWRRLMSRS